MPADSSTGAALLEAELRALDRTLRALPEAAMRRERLLERLEEVGSLRAYEMVAAVMRRPGGAAPDLPHLREVLQDVLREGGAGRPLAPEICEGVLAEAEARGDAFVTRLFREAPPEEWMLEPGAALPRAMAEIPLGVRRALARELDLDLLERLLLDADPIVIEHLLQNPRLTEKQVVRIAARRPVPETTLELVSRSRRFGQRPAVRTALARNPYLPTRLAIQLLGTLPLAVVREIACDATLHLETRRHAGEELARRRERVAPGS
jgi:hypothetical protein